MALKDSRGGREYDKFVADGSGDASIRVTSTSSVTTSTSGGTIATGVGSIEHKVHRPGIALVAKRWGKHWPHERESWRSQMDRMYGGVHMSQNPKRIKKSIKLQETASSIPSDRLLI